MGRLRVHAQSTTDRINKKTAVQDVTVDPADLAHFGLASGDLADARDFNAIWDKDPHATPEGVSFQDFDYAVVGTELRDKPVFGLTGDWDPSRLGNNNVRSQIDYGTDLAGADDGVITWGFYDFITKLGPNANQEHKAYFPFTAAQMAVAAQSIAAWDELINVRFEFVDFEEHDARQWAQGDAPDILLANTLSGPAQAWAYLPTSGGNGAWHRAASDVWIGAASDNRLNLWDGGYGETTQVHELGHSLGLTHPGNYDFGDDNDNDGVPDPITYVGDAFYFQDNRQYTIMSYFDSYDIGSNNIDWNVMRFMYASTPMVHDIWVIQQKYGVDTTTRTGDSTYGFGASADVTNSAMRFQAGDAMTVFSIWDAGGTADTLNLSGYYTPSVIDLREGAYTSAGGFGAYDPLLAGVDPSTMSEADYLAFVNANNAANLMPNRSATTYDLYFTGNVQQTDASGNPIFDENGDPVYFNEGIMWADIVGRDWLMENNIGIAYGTVIENAVGGHGDDRITGNWATNHLTGGAGDDIFVIIDDSGFTLAGDERTDTRHDYITDFTTGEDMIDLTEFASVDSSDVSYVAGELLIDTDGVGGADFIVDLAGRLIDTTNDIVYA